MQLTRDEVEMLSAWREQAVYVVGCLCLRLCLHVLSVPVCLCVCVCCKGAPSPLPSAASRTQTELLLLCWERQQGASSAASSPRLCTGRSWPRASRFVPLPAALLANVGAHCSGARRLWR